MKAPLLALPFLFLLAPTAMRAGDMPPGFFRSDVPAPSGQSRYPAINNNGQIVFTVRSDPYNGDTAELYLYDYERGQLTRLTNDNVRDEFADINDAGTIVWSRGTGPDGPLQIAMLKNGQLTYLTDDTFWNFEARVNADDHIVWSRWLGAGCAGSTADVYFYDGTVASKISQPGYSNQGARINDLDEIVWVRYNDCVSPWTSDVMRYNAGVLSQVTQNRFEPQRPDINNGGDIAWYEGLDDQIVLWRGGSLSLITSWGSGLYMSRNGGHIVFNRWHEGSHTWQVCRYTNGEIWELTSDAHWNFDGRANDRGEVVWHSGTPFEVGIGLLASFPTGDLNCDHAVNILDINAFVLAVSNEAAYKTALPECDPALADINADGAVDVLDINPFVALLAGVPPM
ncbi:hypothetical protein RAS1_12410 [Phycisphaerae bacterium RAS1]|nr:hypothetical protein RAS1_12410 [Phycisphaerae bacterium RAS1]